MKKTKCRYLFVSDPHLPFGSWRRIRECAKFAEIMKPWQTVWLGDVMDCYVVSRFGKGELAILNAKQVRRERESVKRFRDLFQPSSKKRLEWLKGNHEQRLEKRLGDEPFLAAYVGDPIRKLAKKLGVTYRSSGDIILPSVGGSIYVCHGWRSRQLGGMAAASLVKTRSVIQGHSHKMGLVWVTDHLYGMECGHLVDPTAPVFKYASGVRAGLHGWKPGFAWVDWDGKPHTVSLR